MLRGFRACALATLLAPGVVACGGGGDGGEPKPNPVCTGPTPTKGTPVDGALEIGTGMGDAFRASADGDPAELVVGTQGGAMAVPVFRVDASALGTDGTCAYLKVIATLDDGSAPRNFDLRMPSSSPSEKYWFYTTLPLLLADSATELVGKTVTYNAAFRDDGQEADARVSLLLVDNE
jgi:hypothetical protein